MVRRGDAGPVARVGLAGSGRADWDDVAGFGEKPAGGEGGDLLTDGGLRVPVDLLERLPRGESGCLDAELGAGGVPGGDPRSRTPARYSSWVQPKSRAWSANRAARAGTPALPPPRLTRFNSHRRGVYFVAAYVRRPSTSDLQNRTGP